MSGVEASARQPGWTSGVVRRGQTQPLRGLSHWEEKDWAGQVFPISRVVRVNVTAGLDMAARLREMVREAGYVIELEQVPHPSASSLASGERANGVLVAEKLPERAQSGRLQSWFLSWGGLSLELLLLGFLAFLVAGVFGYFNLPLPILIGPVLISGLGLWYGYFSRPQTTDLLCMTYGLEPRGSGKTSSAGESAPFGTAWVVRIGFGIAVSHNRTRSGAATERWLETISAPVVPGPTLHRIVGALVQTDPPVA